MRTETAGKTVYPINNAPLRRGFPFACRGWVPVVVEGLG